MLESGVRLVQRWLARRRLEYDGLVGVRGWYSKPQERGVRFDNSLVLRCLILTFVWSLCAVLLTISQGSPVVGQPMPYRIVATAPFWYENEAGTAAKKQLAEENVPESFRLDPVASRRIENSFRRFFTLPEDPAAAATDTAAAEAFGMLSDRERGVVADIAKFLYKYEIVEDTLSTLLNNGVVLDEIKSGPAAARSGQITDARNRLRRPRTMAEIDSVAEAAGQMSEAILKTVPVGTERDAMRTVFAAAAARMLRGGNLIHDQERTGEMRREAREAAEPVKERILAGKLLIDHGEKVTPEKMDLLRQYFQHTAQAGFRSFKMHRFVNSAFWSMVLILLAGFYLYHVHPEVSRDNRRSGVIGMAVSLSLVANCGCFIGYQWLIRYGNMDLPPELVVSVLPLGLVSALLAPIMGYRVATFAGFFIASIAGLMLDEFSFEYALSGMVICSLSALAVRGSTNYRSFFLRTMIAVAPLIWVLNLGISYSDGDGRTVLIAGLLSLGNGVLTAVLALLGIFVFELLFNIPTNMSLMVLCDYNHPLLERMKREAPGSFFHSMMVATLAEDAARRIGANALRAKAEGLFHDIGKLSNPQYFTENNQDGVNLHEGLTPQMSSIIIRDHVKEGVILARQYKLGSTVLRAIEQHHGNDLVHFFYRQALEQSKRSGDPVAIEQFRYDGVPPREKEIVIVSLADACEAVSRSLTDSSVDRIEGLVGDVFAMRFRDRQLIHSELSLAELEKVRQSFINTLMSMKHGRIAYQKDEDDEDDLLVATADPAGIAAAAPPRTP
ncbi:MAG: HDIG domain-containing protein [Lentisphaeria bacterium]|nr:HDIG domain-containing protein [Lentisphaeria bacterium]